MIEELQKRFVAAMARQEVTTAEGLEAARRISRQAKEEGIDCALTGGIGMHVYGYSRATEDGDLLASNTLELPSEQKLSFGGESYLVQIGQRTITVTVTVRNDDFRGFYEAALSDAQTMRDGLRIVTPEWLVILKYLSQRSKDQLDLFWLLKESGLVDRDRVARLIEQIIGRPAAQVALIGLERFYIQAEIMRAGDENGRFTKGQRPL
ncbi:MAG: hypothetical protein ABIU20_05910 [Blastocatellia bacterium]